jgi:hypothetical protein
MQKKYYTKAISYSSRQEHYWIGCICVGEFSVVVGIGSAAAWDLGSGAGAETGAITTVFAVFVGSTTTGGTTLGCTALFDSDFGAARNPGFAPAVFSLEVESPDAISGFDPWICSGGLIASLSLSGSLGMAFFSGPFLSGFRKRSGTPLAANVPLPTQAPIM